MAQLKNAPTAPPPQFYRPQEVALILGFHYRTVIRRCEDGSIKAEKLGSKWVIPRSSLDSLAKPR
jgi:excisionase family DNA binding protein